jgi:hypothetical protein|tara:strand:- start:4938 stop:5291 length:354 start_codon:yes stop_codon:yes gene_type:complete
MKYLFSMLAILFAFTSQADIVSRNLVGKAADIRLTSNYQEETGLGQVQVQLCPTCDIYQLTITHETNISKDHKPVNLNKFKMFLKSNGNAPMRLQFHNNRKTIFYISLLSHNEEDLQ